jgi:hypothetical protein
MRQAAEVLVTPQRPYHNLKTGASDYESSQDYHKSLYIWITYQP